MNAATTMRIRKPWYNNNRQAWYVDATNKAGKRIKVRLAADRDEAFRIWERDFRPAEVARKEAMFRKRQEQKRASLFVPTKQSVALQSEPSQPAIQSKVVAKAAFESKPEPSSGPAEGREQLHRLLVAIELLAPFRRGAKIEELRADVNDTLGMNYSERTIRRDLATLVEFGVVAKESEARYVWLVTSVRSAMTRQFAEVIACRREGLPLTG